MNLFYPQFRKGSLRSLVTTAVAGSLISGAYGIVHDQITFAISPEYFTKFKFKQFSYADPGLGERAFVVVIGFLATWWVGLIAGWLLWRLGVGKDGTPPKPVDITRRFSWIIASGFICGMAGFLYASLRISTDNFGNWRAYTESIGIDDHTAFVTVGQIHNFGYAGAALGVVIAGVAVRRARSRLGADGSSPNNPPGNED